MREKEKQGKPHVIIEEEEARSEYRQLIGLQFEVRQRGVVIGESMFAEALAGGVRIDVCHAGWASETIH